MLRLDGGGGQGTGVGGGGPAAYKVVGKRFQNSVDESVGDSGGIVSTDLRDKPVPKPRFVVTSVSPQERTHRLPVPSEQNNWVLYTCMYSNSTSSIFTTEFRQTYTTLLKMVQTITLSKAIESRDSPLSRSFRGVLTAYHMVSCSLNMRNA